MALPSAAQPSPQVVGGAFVQQYYFVLHKSPDQVHRFYQDSSILSRPDSDGMMESVTTMQAINDKVLSMDFSEYTAEIETADSQASYKDGVLVVVTGSLTGRDNIRRKFTQTFFLAPQEKGGYVVLNDIFRFVDPSQPRGANQVTINGTNGDASAAALTPEPESTLGQEPQMVTSAEPETLHTVEDVVNAEEVIKPPMENDPPEVSIVVASDPEVHVIQPDEQLVSEVAVSVSQEDEPKKSYASIVKVYKVSQPLVSNSTPVSKTKVSLPKATPPPAKLDALNPEKQPATSLKPSTTLEATVSTGDNVLENNSNDVEGHSIYIRNLPLSTTPEEVAGEFKKFGPIKPGGVQVRNHKVERFCFGFVEFESLDSMQAAIKSSPITIGGRQAFVEEKRTTTRVINGVVTNTNNGGGRGRYLAGRGNYRNDNFRARSGYGANQGYDCWKTSAVGTYGYKLWILEKHLAKRRRKWNWEVFGNIHLAIENLENNVKALKLDLANQMIDWEVLFQGQQELNNAILKEECFLAQKSNKIEFFEGDRNSAYFHACINNKRRHNNISMINCEHSLSCIPNTLEIRNIVESLEDGKAAGPDGFNVMNIPKGIIKKLEGLFNKFLWDGLGKNNIPLRSSQKLCKSFDMGGLGFRNIQDSIKINYMRWNREVHWSIMLQMKLIKALTENLNVLWTHVERPPTYAAAALYYSDHNDFRHPDRNSERIYLSDTCPAVVRRPKRWRRMLRDSNSTPLSSTCHSMIHPSAAFIFLSSAVFLFPLPLLLREFLRAPHFCFKKNASFTLLFIAAVTF
ncbi:ras GTPase-activating protein-binding protein 1-like [Phalaenopsis equestris]|uniref:ras GTPase-activating protein-binding protein 1-like n=1 Tax=Phalaenopsis equestris TaxID=78828 RepID=UPI0009E5EE7E|nr:ras GTPase-activating protein-binding protein 1-like [Phalaenopsis equestris]